MDEQRSLAACCQCKAGRCRRAGPSVLAPSALPLQTVGTAESDCDTIPGRQAMATAFFLAGAFEDTNIYLSSIAEYMQDDQDFMWNYGISKVRIVWDAPAAPAVCLFMLTSELLL